MTTTEDFSGVRLMSSKVLEKHEWIHSWTIDRFNQSFTEIFSQCFDSAMDTKWQLSVNCRQLPIGGKCFGLYVQNMNHNAEEIQSKAPLVKCKIFVVSIYGKRVELGSKGICLKNKITKVLEYYWDSVVNPDFGFLSNGRLCLAIAFEIVGQKMLTTEEEHCSGISDLFVPIDRQSGDISTEGSQTKASERLTLKVENRTFIVNRDLVTSASKHINRVVAANKNSDSYRLYGISAEIFEEMINFVNFGKVRDLCRRSAELLVAAIDFEFDALRDVCIEYIGDHLSAENVIKYLKLAETKRSDILLRKTLLFIDKNYSQFKDTKECLQNFDLILKVAQNFVSKK